MPELLLTKPIPPPFDKPTGQFLIETGSADDGAVSIARTTRYDPKGNRAFPGDDKNVGPLVVYGANQDAAMVAVGVHDRPMSPQLALDALEGVFNQVRKNTGNDTPGFGFATASACVTTLQGVGIRNAGDSRILAVTAEGKAVQLTSRQGEGHTISNYLEIGKPAPGKDYSAFYDYDKIAQSLGLPSGSRDFVFLGMSDGIETEDNLSRLGAMVQNLKQKGIPIDHPHFAQALMAEDHITPGGKVDDQTVFTLKPANKAAEQGCGVISDGAGSGGHHSSMVSHAVINAMVRQTGMTIEPRALSTATGHPESLRGAVIQPPECNIPGLLGREEDALRAVLSEKQGPRILSEGLVLESMNGQTLGGWKEWLDAQGVSAEIKIDKSAGGSGTVRIAPQDMPRAASILAPYAEGNLKTFLEGMASLQKTGSISAPTAAPIIVHDRRPPGTGMTGPD